MDLTSTSKIVRVTCTVALVAGVILALRPTPIARAATITVTVTSDNNTVNGNCTLREAIRAANLDRAVDACPAGNGADTIHTPGPSPTPASTATAARTPTATSTCTPGPDSACTPTMTATPFTPGYWVYLPIIQK